jgi:signal transduction histidine kinase
VNLRGGRRRFGLRPRLLAALVLTAVVTLAVAALALLSPLEHRLRSDGENAVLSAVNVTRGNFLAVRADPRTDAPDVEELTEVSLVLRRRANARVIVLDPQLNIVYQTTGPDPDLADNFSDVRRALATGRQNHSLQGDDFLVAQPIRIGGLPYALALRRRLQYVSPAVHVVRSAFLKAAGAGLLIALLLGVGLTTTLLRRLERLRDATRELERDGAEAEPPLDASHDEIGELTRSFASMHSKLRRQEAARRAFVATASHELRTPLTSLDGMLELLEDDLHADHLDLDDARRRTARAREQSRRLSHLASDLLDLSRLDAEVEMRAEPLELGELSRAVAAEFELHASESRVRLEVDPPSGPCWVLADPGAVARIVRILLDNALRVAPAGSRVELAMSCGKVWASITVRDQGPGVPAAERELIFERFQRGSTTRGEGGFGLGLAIGRELAERMNGSLELESGPAPTAGEPPGAGFTLRLPVAEVSGENGAGE